MTDLRNTIMIPVYRRTSQKTDYETLSTYLLTNTSNINISVVKTTHRIWHTNVINKKNLFLRLKLITLTLFRNFTIAGLPLHFRMQTRFIITKLKINNIYNRLPWQTISIITAMPPIKMLIMCSWINYLPFVC